jgi:HEAT repeat protein
MRAGLGRLCVAASTLAEMARDDLRRERIVEASTISRSHDTDAIIGLLDSPESAVRLHAALAISRQGITQALPELRRHVGSEEDAEVRGAMAVTLAKLAVPESRDTLHGLLADQDEDVRRMGLRGLSHLGDESVIDKATQWYHGGGWKMKQEALDALSTLQTDASRTELGRLKAQETSWWWRRRIRRALDRPATANS